MPKVIDGLPMPKRQRAVFDCLRSTIHSDALRLVSLAGDDGISVPRAATQLGVHRTTLTPVLDELEAAGLVAGTPRRGQRRPGIATVFRANTAAIQAGSDALAAWALGQN